jgi:hypothetical protein
MDSRRVKDFLAGATVAVSAGEGLGCPDGCSWTGLHEPRTRVAGALVAYLRQRKIVRGKVSSCCAATEAARDMQHTPSVEVMSSQGCDVYLCAGLSGSQASGDADEAVRKAIEVAKSLKPDVKLPHQVRPWRHLWDTTVWMCVSGVSDPSLPLKSIFCPQHERKMQERMSYLHPEEVSVAGVHLPSCMVPHRALTDALTHTTP